MGDRFKDRLAAFRDRIEELDIPVNTGKKVESTLSKLEALRNKRDEVAHSQWSPNLVVGEIGHTNATALFKSWKNQKPHKFSTVSQEQLKKTFQKELRPCIGIYMRSYLIRSYAPSAHGNHHVEHVLALGCFPSPRNHTTILSFSIQATSLAMPLSA